jgi:hypothetical protein
MICFVSYQAAEKDSYANSLHQAGVYESAARSLREAFPLQAESLQCTA